MNHKAVNFVVLALSSGVTLAASVPHTFTANTQAVAAEVNENFSALADDLTTLEEAVTTLTETVVALDARTSAIEGSLTVENVAGTYAFMQLIVTQAASTTASSGNYFAGGRIVSEQQATNATFAFLPDGSCSYSGSENHFSVHHSTQTLAPLGQFNSSGAKTGECPSVSGCFAEVDGQLVRDETNGVPGIDASFSGTCTWALNGNELSFDLGDGPEAFKHAAGGRLFTRVASKARAYGTSGVGGREYALMLLMKVD